jgi:ureidoacrylate peracid hydrolase
MTAVLATLEQQARPDRAALLVIDMQNDFCADGGFLHKERGYNVEFANAVADNIADAIAYARAAGMPVVWVRSIYDFKYLTGPHIVKRRSEGCCMEGSWGADFFRLKPDPDDLVIDKHHYSAFRDTRLDTLLRRRGVATLVMTGVATNVCVDSTLRDGFFLGYYIVLLEDCVGSNSKAGHDGTLASVSNNIGIVASLAQWRDVVAGSTRDCQSPGASGWPAQRRRGRVWRVRCVDRLFDLAGQGESVEPDRLLGGTSPITARKSLLTRSIRSGPTTPVRS